jgi:hypothetical protein
MRIRLSPWVLPLLLLPAVASGQALAAENKASETYVAIDTLAATVTSDSGRRLVMTVQAGVDAPNPALHAYLEKVTPRLRDAYTQVLQVYAAELTSGAAPDADYIARKMQEATDRVLKKPGGRLLLGGIMLN